MNVFATTGALLLASMTAVSAHGNIVEPAAVWTSGYPMNGYISEVNNTIFGPMDNSKFGYGPTGAIKYFSANFPSTAAPTLRDFILKNQKMYESSINKECGYTIKDETKLATMPTDAITFSGFSHPGPCELWCDDNKLAYNEDCSTKYPTAKVPIDAAKCSGASKFTIYWIGLQGEPWQVYTNCVYLKGGKAAGGGGLATTTAPKPTATTRAPKPTTAAPVADDADDDEYPTTAPSTTPKPSAPSTTPKPSAPSTSTPKPSATKKCKAKARRV